MDFLPFPTMLCCIYCRKLLMWCGFEPHMKFR
nr:MAG TPA_asm: hypothetical protein [Caudoviricetes sp.]